MGDALILFGFAILATCLLVAVLYGLGTFD